MSKQKLKEIAWAWYLRGSCDGGDPFEGGRIAPEIKKGIRRAFEAYWARGEVPALVP